MTLRFRFSEPSLPVSAIPRLRQLTSLSISELRSRVADNMPLLQIVAFEGDWESERELLASLAREIENGSLLFSVSELDEGDDSETPLSMGELTGIVSHYRAIELEDQRNEALRIGEISEPSEFEPHDDGWTQA